MIKFFRHIRKSLLGGSPTQKYFFYALGEIILVVIGILIALQINNWNEARKNNNYVTMILKEIYTDLSDDYRVIYVGVEPRLEYKKVGIRNIEEYLYRKEAPSDSIFIVHYQDMKRGFLLSQSTGSFESLKQSGLDKIKNDTLRTKLLEFYESTLPRSVNFITGRDKIIDERIEILEANLFNYTFKTINDSTRIHLKYPKNKEYLKHQSLHKIYEMINNDTRHKSYRIKYLKKSYTRIMKRIEKELEKRKVHFEYLDTIPLKRDIYRSNTDIYKK